jgi:hypothetical protein
MIRGESISPIATGAEMWQVPAWPPARTAAVISDKQDVEGPVFVILFLLKYNPSLMN